MSLMGDGGGEEDKDETDESCLYRACLRLALMRLAGNEPRGSDGTGREGAAERLLDRVAPINRMYSTCERGRLDPVRMGCQWRFRMFENQFFSWMCESPVSLMRLSFCVFVG